jgi:Lon protease-like protein
MSSNEPVTLPVFPLGDLVLFPGALTEFLIFEPRYIQMLEHCLDSKGLFCFATLVGNWKDLYYEVPDMFLWGCICSIEHYHKHPDGRYSIIVRGQKKVKIAELPSEQLYRIVSCTPVSYIDDLSVELDEDSLARPLIKRFIEKQYKDIKQDELDKIFDEMGLGHFLPILCHQCPAPLNEKMELLQEHSLKEIFLKLKKYIGNDS